MRGAIVARSPAASTLGRAILRGMASYTAGARRRCGCGAAVVAVAAAVAAVLLLPHRLSLSALLRWSAAVARWPSRLPSHPRCALAASGSAASASTSALGRGRRTSSWTASRRDVRVVATLYGRRHRHVSHMCGGHSGRRTDGSQFDPVRARLGGHGGGGADRRCASAWREVASVAAARFTSTSHRRRCAARARRALAPRHRAPAASHRVGARLRRRRRQEFTPGEGALGRGVGDVARAWTPADRLKWQVEC
mmetsp:Transcript_46295/g.147038  ORF Transcript_46295/g.147038 Transcript_46295/m.147038 type:complete len:252 (+) Transcript_46295:1098-1853(+)